jgi:hypothetical protein
VTGTTTAHLVCSNCGSGSDSVAVIAAIIAWVTAVVTLVLAFATWRTAGATRDAANAARIAANAARQANALRGYLDFFREYRQYEPDRRYVLRHLREHDPDLGITDLGDDPRGHVVNVCHYLDHLGFLVDQRMVDLEAVDRLMGNSVLACWLELEPYIQRERRRRADWRRPGELPTPEDYAPYFNRLVEQLRARRGDADLPSAFVPPKRRPLSRLLAGAMTARPFAELITAISAMTLAAVNMARYWRERRTRHHS